MDKDNIWEQYAQENRFIWEAWVEPSSLKAGDVPASWLALVKEPSPKQIRAIWAKAQNSLSRFISYLECAILDARIAKTKVGYALVYRLKEWMDNDWELPLEGCMLAGLAATEKDIQHFENNLGKLPASLRDLWQIHGFIQRRDESFMSSLLSEQQQLGVIQGPIPYLNREHSWKKAVFSDCLAINLYSEIHMGFPKALDSYQWKDEIIEIMRYGATYSERAGINLDDLLTDTRSFTWLNPGWER